MREPSYADVMFIKRSDPEKKPNIVPKTLCLVFKGALVTTQTSLKYLKIGLLTARNNHFYHAQTINLYIQTIGDFSDFSAGNKPFLIKIGNMELKSIVLLV